MRTRLSIALVCIVVAGGAAPAVADVLWSWQFGTEEGTFVTDGTFAATSAAGSFTIQDVEITASQYPAHVGAAHYFTQEPLGFEWDGTVPTQFWRLGGTYTNGAGFYLVANDWYYGYQPTVGSILDVDENYVYRESLTLAPLQDLQLPVVPTLSGWAVGLLTTTLAAAGAWLLIRREPGFRAPF